MARCMAEKEFMFFTSTFVPSFCAPHSRTCSHHHTCALSMRLQGHVPTQTLLPGEAMPLLSAACCSTASGKHLSESESSSSLRCTT
jgi:hypothetical protein